MTCQESTTQSNRPTNLNAARRAASISFIFIAACAMFLAMPRTLAQEEASTPTSDETSVYAELSKAPRKAAVRSNPMENDRDAVAAGKKLFGLHCAECHGGMAQGSRRAPNLLAEQVQQATPGTLFWVLTNGVVRRGMPVWSKLPEPQRWQLVSYLKSLTPAGKARN
jgi:mono/diheme cytochrome c family protein